MNIERDTVIAKELRQSAKLMNYLERFEKQIRKNNLDSSLDPPLLSLTCQSPIKVGQRYLVAAFTCLFFSLWFDLPGKLRKSK